MTETLTTRFLEKIHYVPDTQHGWYPNGAGYYVMGQEHRGPFKTREAAAEFLRAWVERHLDALENPS
jgi:hypothetical protein